MKLLLKTNCEACGKATCIVFAARVMDGVKGAADCPPISEANREKLTAYLSRFRFEV